MRLIRIRRSGDKRGFRKRGYSDFMRYVRCIDNRGFIYDQDGKLFDETIDDLMIGAVYTLAPPHENDGEMLRVIDGSGEDYLYPATYFEPLDPDVE